MTVTDHVIIVFNKDKAGYKIPSNVSKHENETTNEKP